MFACVLPLSRLRSEQDSCIIVGKTQLGTLSPNKKKKNKKQKIKIKTTEKYEGQCQYEKKKYYIISHVTMTNQISLFF